MYKIFITIPLFLFLFSCGSNNSENIDKILENNIPSFSELKKTCSSECSVSKENYCLENKTFLNSSGVEVSGTCRTISKYNKMFVKCEGFCESYGKNNNVCTNQDGTINKGCR